MIRQERAEMRRRTDGPHPGAATAMGDAEGLVQVQMTYVGADIRGADQAYLRVHVRAVHVDLPAMRVDDLAYLADGRLEHAVRRRIGDHERREGVLMLDRKSTRLNSSHSQISYAVFCLKKKKQKTTCVDLAVSHVSRVLWFA